MSLGFEWDPPKAAANEKKHAVRFEEALTVFDDPLARIFVGEWHSAAEFREIIIGHSCGGRLLLVVFAEQPNGALRVISARCATPREQHDYEHASRQ
jgi:uncharacterized DUF497 family protein